MAFDKGCMGCQTHCLLFALFKHCTFSQHLHLFRRFLCDVHSLGQAGMRRLTTLLRYFNDQSKIVNLLQSPLIP
jgi:hypothetical protein